MKRAAIVVLDGVGIGEAADAAKYGDSGSDTLGNLARTVKGLELPNLEKLGLGNIRKLEGVRARKNAHGAWGLLKPDSAGKDSTAGHWEIAGIHLQKPFPTFPKGFPHEILEAFAAKTGRGVIGNVVSSGTAVIDRFADEQRETGAWIVYTSADSVFQIAAHEKVIPLNELYTACELAREMLVAPYNVSRVIARPFNGVPGSYARTSNRKDYSIQPPGETLLDTLAAAGIPRAGVGKVDDLFAGRSIQSTHTPSNSEGIRLIREWIAGDSSGFLFANLVDFDQMFGHRNDVAGFYKALRELDDALPSLLSALKEEDLLFFTADHGNDPTTPSTDHARENVPLLAAGARVRPGVVGERSTFSDLGATVGDWFQVPYKGAGESFLGELIR